MPLWGFRSAVEMAASAAPKGSGEQAELGERGKVGFLFFSFGLVLTSKFVLVFSFVSTLGFAFTPTLCSHSIKKYIYNQFI